MQAQGRPRQRVLASSSPVLTATATATTPREDPDIEIVESPQQPQAAEPDSLFVSDTESPQPTTAAVVVIPPVPESSHYTSSFNSLNVIRTGVQERPVLVAPTSSLAPFTQLLLDSQTNSQPSRPAAAQVDTVYNPTSAQPPRPNTSTTDKSTQRLQLNTLRATTEPLASPQFSSPFPSVPLHALPELGDSAPLLFSQGYPYQPRASTIHSSPDRNAFMDSSQPTSVRSKESREAFLASLKADRDKLRPKSVEQSFASASLSTAPTLLTAEAASLVPQTDDRRSPSAVPAVQPQQEITQEEMNTSERYESLWPSDKASMNAPTRELGPRSFDGAIFRPDSQKLVVPVSLAGSQRDQYRSTISFYDHLIDRVLATSRIQDPATLSETEVFVQRLRKIALHPDLDNPETLTQYDVAPAIQADWDVTCSAKFRFLKELLLKLRGRQMHVVVIAQPGRILDILKVFMTGLGVAHHTADDIARGPMDQLQVTLLSSSEDGRSLNGDLSDLVIDLDGTSTFDHRSLRKKSDTLSPVLALVVPYTVEHIELSISPHLSPHDRLRALVSATKEFRQEAGRLQQGQSLLQESAARIADYLNGDAAVEWPVPPLKLLEVGSQTDSELDPSTADGIVQVAQTGEKRSLEDASQPDLSKRLRTDDEPPFTATVNPQDIQLDRNNVSVFAPLQSSDVVPESIILTPTTVRLQDLLKSAQERVQDVERDLGALQYRYEELHKRIVDTANERDEAIATAHRATTRMDNQATELSAVKTDRNQLREQVANLQSKLADHSVPERAELERERQRSEQTVVREQKMESRLHIVRKDLEYAQTMYQEASNHAQALAAQNVTLTGSLEQAEKTASAEHARLRKMGYDALTKNLQRESLQLKARVKMQDAALKARDEEISQLKDAGRGRMGTRGASVTRSPRMGSPMKLPDVSWSSASRHGSPAGEIRDKGRLHPLRSG